MLWFHLISNEKFLILPEKKPGHIPVPDCTPCGEDPSPHPISLVTFTHSMPHFVPHPTFARDDPLVGQRLSLLSRAAKQDDINNARVLRRRHTAYHVDQCISAFSKLNNKW